MAWILRPEAASWRILVIEDSPDNMKLFRTLLALKGHEVTGLSGGEDLPATIAGTQPELVLMDIQLPGTDGFGLLEEIRRSPDAAKPTDIREFPDLIARALAGETVSR